MTKLVVSTFYILLTFIVVLGATKLVYIPISKFYEEVPILLQINPSLFRSILVCTLVSSILFPTICIALQHRIFRIFSFIFVFLIFFLKFSIHQGGHSYHIWVLCSFLFCFISEKDDLLATDNFTIVRVIQIITLSHYFFSGLWKVRGLLKLDDFSEISQGTRDWIAYSIAEGNGPSYIFEPFLLNSTLLSTGLIIVILFQISCITPIITQKKIMLWGFGAFIFHALTGFAIGIWFTPTILAVLFNLVLLEIIIDSECKTSKQPTLNSI